MSYCRWSSDNWQCDVYCYEDFSGGFTIHVAGVRVLGDIPKTPVMTKENMAEYLAAHQAQMEFLKTAKHACIGLPHDEEEFNEATAAACADRLEMLRSVGYHVPQYAIDALREEAGAERVDSEGGHCD